LTVRIAVAVAPPAVPEMVAVEVAATVPAVTVNVAVVAPAVTVTLAGTVATAVLLLLRVTRRPPLGAGPLSVTVPTDVAPLVTMAGLSASALTAGAVTVSVADLVTPPPVAEIDEEVFEATG
jgi:hypothetical protein